MESPELIINSSRGAPADVKSLGKNGGFVQDPATADQLRRKLKFFFMNPCEKFQARGRKPWKLGVQILKIAMVTLQLVLFGLNNQMVVLFKEENTIAFKHLFIKNYVDKTDNADNDFAIYTQSEVYEYLSFIFSQYVQLHKISVGNHAYERRGTDLAPLTVCQYFYKRGSINPGNESFNIDPKIETDCFDIEPMMPMSSGTSTDTKLNLTLHFHRLVMVQVQFKLKAINLQTIRRHELPDCYDFCVTITFDNKAHSGRIQINLDNDVSIRECKGWHVTGGIQRNTHYMMIFDGLNVVICLISLILCTRSAVNGLKLQHEFVCFFSLHYDKSVAWSDCLEFVNGWYILIIVSDLLTIAGSILKMEIEAKSFASYDVCSILLGTSTLLVWVGVIRYLGFFEKYNVLILTLRAAFPNVIRFCCCASMIYLGYCFCGWIVLGPYHQKFRSLNVVSECLFSLINGDDMFATFAAMQDKSYVVWLFSRIYLSTFISLFIYMVLSLFIALITDTYETIKLYQQDGFPQTDLHTFIAECKDLPDSGRYRVEEEMPVSSYCCCNRLPGPRLPKKADGNTGSNIESSSNLCQGFVQSMETILPNMERVVSYMNAIVTPTKMAPLLMALMASMAAHTTAAILALGTSVDGGFQCITPLLHTAVTWSRGSAEAQSQENGLGSLGEARGVLSQDDSVPAPSLPTSPVP